MAKQEINIDYLVGQIKQAELYVLYWHTLAVSGAYKQRQIYRGKPGGGEEALTEAELLKDCTDTMLRHIHRQGELIELLAEVDKPQAT